MDVKDLIEKSVHIITTYYQNNLELFFLYMDDDVLWLGPRDGQYMRGKEVLMNAWSNEHHGLTFTLGNITATAVSVSSKFCEVLLRYKVFTHYETGITLAHNQRCHFSWYEYISVSESGLKTKLPRYAMVDVSNTTPRDKRDNIYAVHYKGIDDPTEFSKHDSRKILVHGPDSVIYYLSSTYIYWIESTASGKHSIIHTKDRDIYSLDKLSDFARRYPDCFLRVHASYIVNPMYVYSLRRFKLKLTDGTNLTVPEKKYTSIKYELNKWNS